MAEVLGKLAQVMQLPRSPLVVEEVEAIGWSQLAAEGEFPLAVVEEVAPE